MNVRKAVITAAGRGARLYPAASTVQKAMLPVADLDGVVKPVIQLIAGEAIAAGAEDICIVCAPGDPEEYPAQLKRLRENLLAAHGGSEWAERQAEQIEDLIRRLHFTVQEEPRGYGHAVYCARDFTAGEPFLLLLEDHVYISSHPDARCARQITSLAQAEECSVSGVQVTRESLIRNFGTLAGRRVEEMPGVYQVEHILEKPSITTAELELVTPGLRTGHYLCFFGIHVLTPGVFEILEERLRDCSECLLTPALDELARREKYLALEVQGSRYDIGQKLGLMRAQLALALAGRDADEALASVVELLIESRRRDGTGPEAAV